MLSSKNCSKRSRSSPSDPRSARRRPGASLDDESAAASEASSRRRVGPPAFEYPRRQPRRAIVVVARLTGLARGHAADADGKDQPRRKGDRSFVARGAERVLRQRHGPAAQDGRVILAPALGTDAALAHEPAERLAVLDRRGVCGQILGRSCRFSIQRGVSSRRLAWTRASRTATIKALELLIPAADGRSLSKTTSTP